MGFGAFLMLIAHPAAALAALPMHSETGHPAVAEGTGRWRALRSADPIRGGDNLALVIESENRHEFAAPYRGGSALRLWLARNAAGGEGVMIELTRGQLVCLASQPCTALVRFDDRAPHRIWLEMMEDYAPNRLRVVDGELFGKELAGARRLAIEVTVFQEGAPQFLFDLAGLKEAVAAQMP